MNDYLIPLLKRVAYDLRVNSLKMTSQAGSGHPTSCLSAADIVAVLFFYAMHFDPRNFENPSNDRFILSKGHAAPLLYAVWKELGLISQQDLVTYRDINSVIEGHPTYRFKYTEAATGSLGQGLSIAAGMAMSAFLHGQDFYTYCLLGDMETVEGSVWEAAEIAAYYKLHRLVAILDANRLGQSTATVEEWDINAYARKFEAFGWQAFLVDGHNIHELMLAFDQARRIPDKPIIIVARTIKGYGVEQAANKQGYHGKAFSQEELPEILKHLDEEFADRGSEKLLTEWEPNLPEHIDTPQEPVGFTMPPCSFEVGKKLATRKAYGKALAAAGTVAKRLIVLDAEVKNSTYAEVFEQHFPNRFIQCFIAEQNMVGMAVGLAKRNNIPFASTFSVFFTRAFDQIRMAALSNAPLRLCGSHAGVSIGQDGPSQMGLEDIAMMRTIAGSVILYPCDAVSTYHCVGLMLNHHSSISYLRTTRMDTPIIYPNNETFEIGGCKILRESDQDKACIAAAGVTVHEALKAYDILSQKRVFISVIDLYSVKPFNKEVVIKQAMKSDTHLIIVEDHYQEGGIGDAVKSALVNEPITIHSLAVTKLPRSGKPEALLAWTGIDAQAIAQKVLEIAG